MNHPAVYGVVLDASTQQPVQTGVFIYPLKEKPQERSWLG